MTTPHVLTEVTNLSVGIPGPLRDRYWAHLRAFIAKAQERSVDARIAAPDKEFVSLGLSDLVQAMMRRKGRPLIVTVDGGLTSSLERRGLPFINLHHHAAPLLT